ncbi:MAG: hypothetical protein IKU70_08045 [Clostridia bacterium]|nr:hypothetical protein [Clostridia bacterium]
MNTLPSAKDIALSPFFFWENHGAQSLLRGDILIDKTDRKQRKRLYKT